jgi:hypothetical protein
MRTAIIAAAALLSAAGALAEDFVTHTFSTTVPRGSMHRVVVDVPAGDVNLRNGAGDRINVSGSVKRDYEGDADREKQQRVVNDISVELYTSPSEAVVRRKLGPSAHSWNARNNSDYHVTIEVPPGVDVVVETKYGQVDFDGHFGSVLCDLRAGEIHASLPRESVKDLTASVRVGEVHASVGDRRIDNEGVFPRAAKWTNPAGGHGSSVNLHTTAGEVHVTLKP